MAGNQKHIVHKQILEIQGATLETRQYWEEHLRRLQRDRILPLLQEVFDKVSQHNVHIRIDSLDIHIPSRFTFKEQEELKKTLTLQIQDQVMRQGHSGRTVQSPSETYQEGLSFFLQHGYFPWWVDRTQTDFLQQAKQAFLTLPDREIKAHSVKWFSQVSVCKRLIAHFQEDELQKLVSLHLGTDMPEGVLRLIEKLVGAFPQKRISIWYAYITIQSTQGWTHSPEVLSLWTFANKLQDSLNIPTSSLTAILSNEGLANEAREDLISILSQHSPDTYEYASLWLNLQDLIAQASIPQRELTQLYKEGYHGLRLLTLLLKQLVRGSDAKVLPLLTRLVKKLSSSWSEEWEAYHRHVAFTHKKEPQIYTLEELLEALILREKAHSFLSQYGSDCLETLIRERLHSGEKNSLKKSRPLSKKAPTSDESIPVSHAGIVLLAPFIPTLFQKTGLTEKGSFVNSHGIQKAITLLYYLATGEVKGEEQDYLFFKLLCTGNMDVPLDYEVEVIEEELTEADHMMEAVCLHGKTAWGSMSAPSIRKLFVNRTGLLKMDPYQWSLQVERKDEDILLGKVPWGFQHVRFSWLEKTISVEW